MSNHYDVIVAGAGIGGLCAALRAREKGASVAIIEKAETIGGSAAASGGTIWCAKNIDEWLKVQPNGDITLGTALIDHFYTGIEWLRKQGVSLEVRGDKPYKFQRTIYQFTPDARTAMETLSKQFQHMGGTILTKTDLTGLIGGNGEPVTGVQNHTLKNNSPIRHPINRRISGQPQIARTVFRHRIRSHDRPRRPPKHRRRISKRTRSRRATYRTPQPLLRPPPPGTPRTSRPAQLPRRQTRLQRIRHLNQPQRRAIRRRISRRRSHLPHPRSATPGHRHPHL